MVTCSGVGTTSITLSDRGTKDSKVEDTEENTTDVSPCISLIRPHSTSLAARSLRESQNAGATDSRKPDITLLVLLNKCLCPVKHTQAPARLDPENKVIPLPKP